MNKWLHIDMESPTDTHSKGQHDLSEVLVSYDSLLDSFDCIFGPEKNNIRYL